MLRIDNVQLLGGSTRLFNFIAAYARIDTVRYPTGCRAVSSVIVYDATYGTAVNLTPRRTVRDRAGPVSFTRADRYGKKENASTVHSQSHSL